MNRKIYKVWADMAYPSSKIYIHTPGHSLHIKAAQTLWFGLQKRWSRSTIERVRFLLKEAVLAKIKSEEDGKIEMEKD